VNPSLAFSSTFSFILKTAHRIKTYPTVQRDYFKSSVGYYGCAYYRFVEQE